MGASYDAFCALPPGEKMKHIRDYSRSRLQKGEQLWWLEDEDDVGIELQVKLYKNLSKQQKAALRAEGAILFPQICGHSRDKEKVQPGRLLLPAAPQRVLSASTRYFLGWQCRRRIARRQLPPAGAHQQPARDARLRSAHLEDALFPGCTGALRRRLVARSGSLSGFGVLTGAPRRGSHPTICFAPKWQGKPHEASACARRARQSAVGAIRQRRQASLQRVA